MLIIGLSPVFGGLGSQGSAQKGQLNKCPRHICTGHTCTRHMCRAHPTTDPVYKTREVYVSHVGGIHMLSPNVHRPHGYDTGTAPPPARLARWWEGCKPQSPRPLRVGVGTGPPWL